ncbi:unnamed protein product [Prunus armeniaca]|uniref:Uncharacterized protein n=1 Tax=Prunus armeniaca TaxID=36596 RepID=A0A6J5UXH9_PRUAR|nr:unnamed protein product [Prunus armeniaca]
MKRSYGEEISFTLGPAIPLTDPDEIYNGDYIVRLMIRVYMDGKKMDRPALSSEERDSSLSSIIQAGLSEIEPITAREIRNRNRSYPTHITALKPCRTELKPFIVADTETLLIDNVHSLMLQIYDILMDSYFSEDYSIILDSFEERSTKVLYDLVLRISTIVRQEQSLNNLLPQLPRFDGILCLSTSMSSQELQAKPMMRNHRLYELAVYSGTKMLFRSETP